jgi:hypothetical protein
LIHLCGEKFDELCGVGQIGVKDNRFDVVFKNLYNRLQDLSPLTKPNASKDITNFGATQVVNIMFRN